MFKSKGWMGGWMDGQMDAWVTKALSEKGSSKAMQ